MSHKSFARLFLILAVGGMTSSCHEVSAPVDTESRETPPGGEAPAIELSIELLLPPGRGRFVESDTVTVYARVLDRNGVNQPSAEVEWQGPVVSATGQSALATLRLGVNTIVGSVRGKQGQSVTSASLTVPATPRPGEMLIWSPDGSVARIPAPPGVTDISPVAMNDRGEIVGWFDYFPNSRRAFVWTSGSGFRELTSEFAGRNLDAVDINDHGVVAGTVYISSTEARGFTWSEKEGFALIQGDSPSYTFVSGINNGGRIVGSRNGRPFLWTREGGFSSYAGGASSLPSYEGAWLYGVAVNELNEVLTSGNGKYSRGIDYAFHYDGNPSIWSGASETGLGCRTCVVSAMNNRREVVGVDVTTGRWQAFKWSAATGVQILPGVAGQRSEAVAINESGAVAGSVLSWDAGEISRAAVWHGATLTLIGPLQGFRTTNARDINSLGQVLVYAR